MSAAAPSRAGPAQTSSQRRGPAAAVVFEDVEVDAVGVRELRPRVGPGAGQDAVRRAEPVAERVQVVDAHDERGQRRQRLAPRHPVRDGPHVDRGQHRRRRASRASRSDPSSPGPTGRSRMFWLTASVIPARRTASTHSRASRTVMASGFWARMPRTVLRCDGFADDRRLRVRRDGDVEHLDRRVGEQVVDGGVDRRDAVTLAATSRARVRVARGDGDRVEPGLAIGDQVAVAHDEPGPAQPIRQSRRLGRRGR